MALLFVIIIGGLLTFATLRVKRGRFRFLNCIEVITLPQVAATRLTNKRDILIFLPPRYSEEVDQRYKVLYINDGQDHEHLQLRETLAKLMSRGRIQPVIVVIIPANEDRLLEYGTVAAPNNFGFGTRSSDYAQFVVDELMPLIDDNFRTQPGATFLGVSLGGLSAFDIAWNHPDRFTAAGVMSGSFWWRAAEDEVRIEPGLRIPHSVIRNTSHLPSLRIWFEAGTRDEVCDRDGNGVIDSIQDTLELVDELASAGYPHGLVSYIEVDGGRHDYETWARVLPDFLMWAFSPELDPQRP